MSKTIKEEIIDYLKENDMYYVEEYDEEGFPYDSDADSLVGDLTNAELCNILIESMEDIAEIQRKKDIDKACEWFSEHIIDYACYNEMDGWNIHHKEMHEDFCKAMEDEI